MVAIAQVIEAFAYGAAKSVLQLCEVLGPGDRATIYYGLRQGTEIDLKSANKNIDFKELPGSGPTKHLSNVLYLNKELREGFDIVHGHSSYGGMYAKLLGPRHNLHTIYSPRGYSFLREDYPAVARWMFRQMEKVTANRCLTVCCGPYEYRLAKELGGDAICINNGFKIGSEPSLDSLGGPILGVGRICPQKGFDIFAEVSRRLPQHSFVWVGDLQKEDRSAIANLPANLKLIHYIPHAEMLEMIRGCRFVFLPSRWEGLSRFLIESVCMGKAIVTSRFPGNVDCLDGDPAANKFANGYSCEAIEEYTVAVDRLATDNSLVDAMQRASFQHGKRAFDIDKIVDHWRRLYHSFGHRESVSEQQSHAFVLNHSPASKSPL